MPENLSMKMNVCVCCWEGEKGDVWEDMGGERPRLQCCLTCCCNTADLCVYVNPAGFGLIGWSTVSSFIDFMAEGKMQ